MFRTRALSSVVVVLVGVIPAFFGVWGATVAVAALGLIGLAELRVMFAEIDHEILLVIAAPVLLLTLVAVAAHWPAWTLSALAAATLLAPACLFMLRPSIEGSLRAWLATGFAALYLAIPLAHLVAVRQIAGVTTGSGAWLTRLEAHLGFPEKALGLGWFLLALVTSWLTDTFAYLSGRAFGKRLMTPVLSPKKTWEGFAGGVAGGILTAVIANWCFGVGMRGVVAVGAGIVIALAATAGDLAESLLKRQTGVKDSGTLIPGHGGVLDRIDSQLFVFVVVYYFALAVGA
ncbi:MAG: phosphatidate cytidylyltransferase [Thermomicrobiales bacterium]